MLHLVHCRYHRQVQGYASHELPQPVLRAFRRVTKVHPSFYFSPHPRTDMMQQRTCLFVWLAIRRTMRIQLQSYSYGGCYIYMHPMSSNSSLAGIRLLSSMSPSSLLSPAPN